MTTLNLPTPGSNIGTWGTVLNAALNTLNAGKAEVVHSHTQAESHNSPDTDSSPTALHHTLGAGANQAAAGTHSHSGFASTAHGSTHISSGSDPIPAFTSTLTGLVPASGGGTTNFLRADGTWASPPTASTFTSVASGTVPASGGGTVNYLRADGSWAVPPGGGGGTTYVGWIDVVGDYGAAGDALPINVTISSGSANATLTTGTIPSSGFSGKRIVISGAGVGGVPLVTTISSRTDATHIVLANTASTSVTASPTYWGTDDTSAIQTARDAWKNSEVSYADGQNVMMKALYFRPGKYLVTSQDALMDSPRTGTAHQFRNGVILGGWGTEGTEIIFATTVSAATVSADPSQGNLLTLIGRANGFSIRNLKVRSLNANQSFCYIWTTSANDGSLPTYGTGYNRRMFWDAVDLRGDWNRGWGLDGDSNVNLNSEMRWRDCYVSDSVTFADGFLRGGITHGAAPQSTTTQFDQMVNYIFENCIFEYANGSLLKMDYGGHITVIGGSWVGGVGGGSNSVTFFDMGNYAHNFYTKHLSVLGTRFEMRTANSQLFNMYWTGSTSHVTFDGVTVVTNSIGTPANYQMGAINGTTNVGNWRFTNCELGGYILWNGTGAATLGRIVFDQCNFTDNSTGGIGTTTGFLRYTSTFTPKYRYRDCYNVTDASN